jgi:hypothetical protein
MKINQPIRDIARAEAVQAPGTPGVAQRDTVPQTGGSREDRVQISDAGRALLASQHDAREHDAGKHDARRASSANAGSAEATTMHDALSDDHVQRIHQRLQDGTYLSSETAEHVARAILRRGDI